MPVKEFPDPRLADEDGLLALGGDLHADTLILAYRNGIFPWPSDELDVVPWFSPAERGILEFDNYRLPRSFKKFLKKCVYECTIDADFDSVIEFCARVPRPGQNSTWITEEMIGAYKEFHRKGYAHSIEVWERMSSDGSEPKQLIGGLYGVEVEGVFSGESMFSLKNNASKVALHFLVQYLTERGARWIDTQMTTPLTTSFGAKTVIREEFLKRLKAAQSSSRRLFPT